MIYFISMLFLFSCGQVTSTENNTNQESTHFGTQTPENLKTGWYYLTESGNGIEKTLDRTDEIYFIDPNPIVTVDNFTDLEIYQSIENNFGLTIRLDKKGAKRWSVATGKSIGKKLALIIDNKLYFTPTVNAQIDVGITALNRGDLTEEELKVIKKKIEKGIKKARP